MKFNLVAVNGNWPIVAPARERGLKLWYNQHKASCNSRSREGAWIEIFPSLYTCRTSRVAPARERGLKFNLVAVNGNWPIVAPARERGLKCKIIMDGCWPHSVAPARERGLKYCGRPAVIKRDGVAPARERGLK